MRIKQLPDIAFLESLLRYDPVSGDFTWKERSEEIDPNPRTRKAWNKRFAGQLAGKNSGNGYKAIRLAGSSFYSHRLAWKMATGHEPAIIDHQDGDTQNNRIANLRNTDFAGNQKNNSFAANNTSGHMGVAINRYGGWRAFIRVDKKQRHLGVFADIADAIAARQAAEVKFGFHPNHGWSKK